MILLQVIKMGIKNLHQLLRKHCPDAYKGVNLRDFAFEKVAVDASLFLYKYKAAAGPRWLSALLNLIMCLRRNDVHCFFVFDGEPPPEKAKEKARRSAEKDKLRERAATLEEALKAYDRDGKVTKILTDVLSRRKKSPTKIKKLLSKSNTIDVFYLERYLERLKNQIISLTPRDIELSQNLLRLLGVPFCTSPTEAETLCAFLSLEDKVKAVMSEDTDLLAYGCPELLHKVDTMKMTCISLQMNQVLLDLDLSMETFRDLCIMCGTDYNPNIPRVGPHGAFALLKTHKTIENITTKDVSCLNHERVRELFTKYPYDIPDVPFCGQPSWDELGTFIFQHQCGISLDKVRQDLGTRNITFPQ